MSTPAEIFAPDDCLNPQKPVDLYEDLPITDKLFSDFIDFGMKDAGRAFYFWLSLEKGSVPQGVLPEGAAPIVLDPLQLRNEEFSTNSGPVRSKYLFAIDRERIHVALDSSRSVARRGQVTHTNLCRTAFYGGEVFFLSSNRVILTPNSGRFGCSLSRDMSDNRIAESFQTRWRNTILCWERCGFLVSPTVHDILNLHEARHRVWNERVWAQVTAEMFANATAAA